MTIQIELIRTEMHLKDRELRYLSGTTTRRTS
jgi:hypothetical protein